MLKAAKEWNFDPFISATGAFDTHDVYGNPGDLWKTAKDAIVEIKTKQIGPNHYIQSRHIKTPAGILTEKIEHYENPIHPWSKTIEYLVKSPEDFDKIPYMLPDLDNIVHDHKKKILISYDFETEKFVGDRGITMYSLTSGPLSAWSNIMPREKWIKAFYSERSSFIKLLRILMDWNLEATKNFLEEANSGKLCYSWWWFEVEMFSHKMFQKAILPLLKEHVNLVHEYDCLYRLWESGPNSMQIMKYVVEAGVDLYSTFPPPPHGNGDITKIKREIGDKVCLMGNICPTELSSPQEIDKLTKQTIEAASPGGGYILGSSYALHRLTNPEIIKVLCKAGRKYGKY
jgi:hypothetical protein